MPQVDEIRQLAATFWQAEAHVVEHHRENRDGLAIVNPVDSFILSHFHYSILSMFNTRIVRYGNSPSVSVQFRRTPPMFQVVRLNLDSMGFHVNAGAGLLHKPGIGCVRGLALMAVLNGLVFLLPLRAAWAVSHAGIDYHAGGYHHMAG